MKRRNFIKSSICFGCAGACGLQMLFANAEEIKFTPEEEVAMQKFMYKSADELPQKIRLDICNLCQLNCPWCYIRQNEDEIKKYGGGFGYVSFKQFKNFIKDNPFIKEIEVSNHGEIFLNPDFDKIIKYAYEKDVALTAWTGVNLNTLSEETAENLVKYQFKHIVVSIDGTTPETYAIYRRGGDFNTVINNIKMINKYKKMYGSIFPKLIYKFIVFGHNEHEIENVRGLAQELNMAVKFEANFAPWYSPVKDKERVRMLTGINYISQDSSSFIEKYNNNSLSWYFCTGLFSDPQFNFNGDFIGCCINSKTFGCNIFKESFLDCLNNKNVLYTKLMLTDCNYRKQYSNPCNTCWYYRELKDNNVTIRL